MTVAPIERDRANFFGLGPGTGKDMNSSATHGNPSTKKSEQKITLCERQFPRRLTGQQFTIGPHLIGFRIDLDLGAGLIQFHLSLAQAARAADRPSLAL